MDSKLTVRLDNHVIDRAKSYARNHNISVSRMIESYLDFSRIQYTGWNQRKLNSVRSDGFQIHQLRGAELQIRTRWSVRESIAFIFQSMIRDFDTYKLQQER